MRATTLMLMLALSLGGCGEGELIDGESWEEEEGADEGALSPDLEEDGREPMACQASFAHPAAGAPVTSKFGPRGGGYHYGVDLGIHYGNVRAAEAGVVTVTGWDAGGYGRWIELKHCGGYRTRYGHLSAFKQKKGSSVARGQTIAQSGSTGKSTGPHLHFEVRLSGAAKNPCTYIDCY